MHPETPKSYTLGGGRTGGKCPPGGWEGNLSRATALGWRKKKKAHWEVRSTSLPSYERGLKIHHLYAGDSKGKLILSALLSKSPSVPGRCKGKITQTPQDSHSQRNMIKSKNYQKLKKQTTWKGSTTTMQRFRTQTTHILKWSDTKYKMNKNRRRHMSPKTFV